jgi:glycerophosphoryl diester phosphodiesterase
MAVSSASTARQLVQSDRVLIIAHRGDSRVAPENTLPAFASALRLGVDFVELDYWHSADGVPVVFHDEFLDRRTDALARWGGERIRLSSKTLDELRELDAGSWFGPQFAGTRLPTLAEALKLIQPTAMTMIERKGGDADTCVELLRKTGALDRVTVQAFDWEFLAECHRLAPELVLGALGEKELLDVHVQRAREIGATIVGWEAAYLDGDNIARLHDAGFKAWAWTVDEPLMARRLVAAGLDGVISNVPGPIREAIRP